MSTVEYGRYELLRTFRNRRFYIFSFGFPLVLYYAIAGPNRNVASLGGTGISAPLYFMVGLAAFGTMNAVLGSGARIAAERSVGWNRQLRLTPPFDPDVLPRQGADCVCDGARRDRAPVYRRGLERRRRARRGARLLARHPARLSGARFPN